MGEKSLERFAASSRGCLVQMAPDLYKPYVTLEKGQPVLYLEVLKALYGMLQSSLLW